MEQEENNSSKFGKTLREWWLLIAVGGAIVVITAVLAATIFVPRMKTPSGPVAPKFVLRDQQGRLTSLAQFRGKVVLLTFLDPECHQLCPLTTQSMLEAIKMLGPRAASQVEMLGVNVNVKKNKPADVAAYTRTHELRKHWRFLTGPPAQLKKVWNDYHVYVSVSPDGDVQHTAVTYVIGPRGGEQATFSTSMSYAAIGDEANVLARAIAPLLPGSPGLSLPPPPAQQTQTPSSAGKAKLTAIGSNSKRVAFGTTHPHLMVFFAGWLGPETALAKHLSPLDGYAVLARRRDWPSPVAVDELTTEPSVAEARQILTPLAATLRAPIVQDSSGQLADYYRVNDLPWFVLSSSKGKIIWSHDGWLPAATLSRDVRSALAKN